MTWSGTLIDMDTHGSPGRFRDPEIWLSALAADDIQVACPRCGSRAVVTAQPVEGELVMCWPRRFVCTDDEVLRVIARLRESRDAAPR